MVKIVMGAGDNGKRLGHTRQHRATRCDGLRHRFDDLFLQAHASSARLHFLRFQEDNTGIFKRAPNSFDIRGRARRRPALTFHAPYCWHGQLCLLGELRLGPVQQCSSSAYLSGGQFRHVAFAIMLAKNDHDGMVRDSKRLIRTRKANQCLDAHLWRRTRTYASMPSHVGRSSQVHRGCRCF